jgi:hypothetical protein
MLYKITSLRQITILNNPHEYIDADCVRQAKNLAMKNGFKFIEFINHRRISGDDKFEVHFFRNIADKPTILNYIYFNFNDDEELTENYYLTPWEKTFSF